MHKSKSNKRQSKDSNISDIACEEIGTLKTKQKMGTSYN